jgi:hypothetical protein
MATLLFLLRCMSRALRQFTFPVLQQPPACVTIQRIWSQLFPDNASMRVEPVQRAASRRELPVD